MTTDQELAFEEVVKAYFDCRKRKKRSLFATEFEFELEKNLFDLYLDLKNGDYRIGKSIAFVVEQPKIREIWCATFKDRVVHHVIYNRLEERFYNSFIRNSFACIPGRGTLDASNYLWSGMRSITNNWTVEEYFLSADIRNFFVSINKQILFKIVKKKVSERWLLDLVEQVIFHNPKLNCVAKSSIDAFNRVPKHKSLWHSDDQTGLPIGNLTSQFFANVYMNELDQFAKHKLKTKYYFRYVDDFIILGDSPAELNGQFEQIKTFLENHLKLELHPFKKRIATISQGIDFVGFLHKPYRRYPRRRTINRLFSIVNQWKKSSDKFELENLKKIRSSVNSYFGLIKHTSSFNIRKKIANKISCLFIFPDKKLLKMQIPVQSPQVECSSGRDK